MKVKYNDTEIELLYSFRSNLYFEQIQGKNIDFTKFSAQDLVVLFYCVFIASLQKNKLPIVSMNDFMDIIDDNNGEKCLVDFANWYINTIKTQYELMEDMDDDTSKKQTKKSSKKKN